MLVHIGILASLVACLSAGLGSEACRVQLSEASAQVAMSSKRDIPSQLALPDAPSV